MCDVECIGGGTSQSIGQPDEDANPARGQLKRKSIFSFVSVRAREFRLAKKAWPSRPASAWLFSTLRPNLVLTHGIPPVFRDGVHLCIHNVNRHRVSTKFISPRNCAPMALTAEILPAQGQ